MEKSKFEALPDRILKLYLQQLCKSLEVEHLNNSLFDIEDVSRGCDSVSNMLGLGSNKWIDIDYIYSIILENGTIPSDGSFKSRPEINEYTFDIEVEEVKTVWSTFEHNVDSYNRDSVKQILQLQEGTGDWSYYDGRIINEDVTDSSTERIRWGKIHYRG